MPDPTATIPAIDPLENTIVVRIPGRPISWKRPENTARGGRRTDPKVRDWQRYAAAETDRVLRRAGEFTRPVFAAGEHLAVTVASMYPRPKRATSALPAHADVDNLAKIVLDALEGIAYANDRQIVTLTTAKGYADGPGFVEITLHNVHPLTVDRDPADTTTVEVRP